MDLSKDSLTHEKEGTRNSRDGAARLLHWAPQWAAVPKGFVKHAIGTAIASKSPITERLVERPGAVEHVAHIRDVVDPPVVQRLIERRLAHEHIVHPRDA